MKKIFLILSFFSIFQARAQVSQKNKPGTSSSARKGGPADIEKAFKPKKAVSLDYNSWYEILGITDSSATRTETKAAYYGIGIGYDYTVYQPEKGYGFNAGYIQGFGIAGKASDAGTYYQKRAPWSALRAGARYFSRVNNRIEIGLAVAALYRQNKWGSDSGYNPVSPTNPVGGLFVDTRWRLNYKLEVLQSIGSFSKDTGIVWRIGASYTLN